MQPLYFGLYQFLAASWTNHRAVKPGVQPNCARFIPQALVVLPLLLQEALDSLFPNIHRGRFPEQGKCQEEFAAYRSNFGGMPKERKTLVLTSTSQLKTN
jgi:hypothetical protein